MGIRVSFVVIAYNEAKNIGRTLDAITSLAGLDDYEVVVVNDGSRDATAEVIEEHAAGNPRVKLINLAQNRGRGYARSTGISAAQGELIATVDADIVLPVDWFVRAAAALRGHDAVGGTAVPDGDVAYVYQATRLLPRVVAHTTAVTGSNALYRRQVFDIVAFDSSLRDGEDVALNQATKGHGLSFETVPGLLVEHIENKTFPETLRWLFTSGRGATRQLLTYRQLRVPDLAAGTFVAGAAAGVAVAVLVSPLGLLLPAVLLVAISAQHVRSRFVMPVARWRLVTTAVAIDCALLLAYFTGRLAGLSWLARKRPAGRARVVNSAGGRPSGDLGQPVRVLRDRRDDRAHLAGGGKGIRE